MPLPDKTKKNASTSPFTKKLPFVFLLEEIRYNFQDSEKISKFRREEINSSLNFLGLCCVFEAR